MPSKTLPKPDYATKNMRLVGYSDQGGRCDGVQIMVHRGYAYIGHIFSKGFSVVDVRDPTRPKPVNYIAAPPNTWPSPAGPMNVYVLPSDALKEMVGTQYVEQPLRPQFCPVLTDTIVPTTERPPGTGLPAW